MESRSAESVNRIGRMSPSEDTVRILERRTEEAEAALDIMEERLRELETVSRTAQSSLYTSQALKQEMLSDIALLKESLGKESSEAALKYRVGHLLRALKERD
jgi:hypothetical protein